MRALSVLLCRQALTGRIDLSGFVVSASVGMRGIIGAIDLFQWANKCILIVLHATKKR
jgi:hypothetical protein